jgi:hypothetical protein
MKIIINGAGFQNKGAEAMLRTVQVELAKRLPDCEFFLWQILESDYRPALNSGFTPFRLPFEKKNSIWHWDKGKRVSKKLWSLLELIKTLDPRQVLTLFEPNKRLVKACRHYFSSNLIDFDALIDISGFAYSDAWGVVCFESISPLLDYFVRNGKPVLFYLKPGAVSIIRK